MDFILSTCQLLQYAALTGSVLGVPPIHVLTYTPLCNTFCASGIFSHGARALLMCLMVVAAQSVGGLGGLVSDEFLLAVRGEWRALVGRRINKQ